MSTGEARRVCVITGAGGKLGNAFCKQYAADYDIVAVCRTRVPGVPSQFESYVDPLAVDDSSANANRVFVVMSDLAKPGEADRVVDLVLARYDGVDLVVNNAAETAFHPAGLVDNDAAFADFDRFFKVNVSVPAQFGALFARKFWTSRAHENRERNRNIVNVSSLSGNRVYPGGGQAVYASSKAALNHMTRYMAQEFEAFGVRVNGLAPTAFPAQVSSETVADAVVRLDRESVTGKILVVDREPQPSGDGASS
ncbi:SDR family NAD(P)-dependent oxidoreductase [Nocardioides jensenii]|uniref:SDR family NAD(P)-dependent oxidoreductase n=1 Tax=Nocardioides jensenii TaxID=1843 RepID=UPI00082973C5|nr:SDR family NAD(P)-dependent oxidoreductase [Nocardioides jensenii]